MDWILVSPLNSHVEALTCWRWLIWSWGLWKVTSVRWDQETIWDLCPYKSKKRYTAHPLPAMWETERRLYPRTRKGSLIRTQLCWHPDFRLLTSRTEFLLLELPSVWHFVMAAQAGQDNTLAYLSSSNLIFWPRFPPIPNVLAPHTLHSSEDMLLCFQALLTLSPCPSFKLSFPTSSFWNSLSHLLVSPMTLEEFPLVFLQHSICHYVICFIA
jgi:hypothetical protein